MSPFSWGGHQGQERGKIQGENASKPNRCVGSCQHAVHQAGGHLEAWTPTLLQRVFKCAQPIDFLSISTFKPKKMRVRSSLLLKLKIATNKILTRTNLY